MDTNEPNYFSPLKRFDQNEPFDLRQILAKYLNHWKYFVVTSVFSLILASVYLYYTKPIHLVKATLLIQDDKKISDEQSSLQEIEVVSSSKLVENEIEVLKSRNLVLQVVNNLQLWCTYYIKDSYKTKNLYSKSPVELQMTSHTNEIIDTNFEISIKDDMTFQLKDATDQTTQYNFNKIYETLLGVWKLKASENIKDFIGKTIFISIKNPEKTAYTYETNLEVILKNKDAPVVSLMIRDEVEQRGKDFLNSLIEQYNITTISEKAQKNQSTLNFIDQRLAALSRELNTLDLEVERFRSSRGLTDISTQSEVYLENVQTNDMRLNEVNVQLNVIEGIEKYLQTSENPENLPSVTGILDPGLNYLIQQLTQLQNKKAELLATTPENNPVFNPLNRQIEGSKSAIINSISNTKQALISTRQELESFNSKFESSIRNIPVQERQLVSIKRQQTIKEDLYLFLLQKKEELSLSYAATLTDAKVIDSAYTGPERQFKKVVVVALAFMFALSFPIGIIYAKDLLKNTISNQEDVKKVTNATVLGKIFHHNDSKEPNVFVSSPDEKTAETFRTLRTNINFSLTNNSHKTILVTSCVSGEGKTFNAINIAASYAKMGKKTILLNFDLRNSDPILKSGDNKSGISLFLTKKKTLTEIIQKTDLNNLDVIHSGPASSNPQELMESETISDLFDFLKNNYDYIIIDTPPLAQVSDALAIIKYSNINLIIARCNSTKKKLLKLVLNELKIKNINSVYIVLNDNKLISEQMGYGYNQNK